MTLQEIMSDKKTWRSYMKRVKALPKDYQIVYKEITNYLYKVGPVELGNNMSLFYGIIELFEEGALNKKRVLEVTGEDVALFCDELIKDSPTYLEAYEEKKKSKGKD